MRIVQKSSSTCARILFNYRAVAGLGISLLSSGAAPAQAPPLDLDNAWFRPTLVVDQDPMCGEVLNRVRQSFFSNEPLPEIGPHPEAWFPDMERITFDELQSEPVKSEPANAEPGASGERHFLVAGGRKVYFEQVSRPGCGGRCDRRIFFTSNRPFHLARERASSEEADAHRMEVPDYSYSLLRSAGGELYIASQVHSASAFAEQGAIIVYRLATDADWFMACKVANDPGDLRKSGNANVRSFLGSLDALQDALADIARGEGACGTLNAGAAGYRYRTAALEMALYRPWALFTSGSTRKARYETQRNARSLKNWAVSGISEHEALARYDAQLAETRGQLARFYEIQFKWPRAQAEKVADVVLTTSIWFAFPSGHDPFVGGGVRELRRAILESRPLAEIRAIEVDLAGIDGDADPRRESVLNVAVRHPAALRYLLGRGADPNKANGFGKTPLMYAAQYGSVDAADLLLDHGADPNAKTVWPADTCYYDLETASMTALHYAVRYASAEFVKMLIDRDAVPYIRTDSTFWSREPAYPLDWLRMYNSAESGERNGRITDEEVPELAELLAVPSAEWLAEFARRMTLQAEAEYARGDIAAAYDTLRRALNAEPGNVRALSDLSLVALRVDSVGEAGVAAVRVIGSTEDPGLLAGAWFNLGRACETVEYARAVVEFNGIHPCLYSKAYPFLQSWLTEPTESRAKALERVFAEHATCTQRREDGSMIVHYLHSGSIYDSGDQRSYRLYAWHRARTSISADTISWTGWGNQTATAEAVTSYDVGESVLSVFKGPGSPRFHVDGVVCGD